MSSSSPGHRESPMWPPPDRRWRLGDFLALAAWTLAIAWYFWDVLSFRGALFYYDISEINYPYRDFFANELKAGRFSRWHPGLYCGLPLYSESQAGYLHPLKYLFYPWMPTWKAFTLDMVGSVWLTGVATYGWLRRHVGAAGALTGAAILGLGGFTWAHFIHSSMNNALVSVPLIIWGLELSWSGGRLRGVALGAMALACQVFAGHLQDALFSILLVGLYGCYRAVEETGRRRAGVLLMAIALILGGVLLSAVQWIPSKELLDRSPRSGGLDWETLTYGSWSPELLPTMVVREAYGTRARDTDWMDGFYPYHEMDTYLGLVAIGLAVLGGACYRNRWVSFWVILACVAGMLMLGRFTFLMDHAHRIPILGSSRIPVRFHQWLTVAVSALAAVGVERLSRPGTIRLRPALLVIGSMVLCSIPILFYVYEPVWTQPGRWTLTYHRLRYEWLGRELTVSGLRTLLVVLAGGGVAWFASRSGKVERRRVLASSLPVLVMIDLLGAHYWEIPTVPPGYWTDPPTSAETLRRAGDDVRVFTVPEKASGEPGYASEPIDFLAIRDTLGWSLPPVWGISTSIGLTPVVSSRLLDYFDQASQTGGRFDIEAVTHWVTGRPQAALPGPPETVGSAYLYRNERALPRARLMVNPVFVSSAEEARAAMARLGRSLRDYLVVEDPDRPDFGNGPVSGRSTILRDEPECVEVEVEADRASYLILADTFDPGWSATIDGKPAPIRPAYLAFRAVAITPGSHRVVFEYRPAGFALGLWVSALAALGIAPCLLLNLRWIEPQDLRGPSRLPGRWPVAMASLVLAILFVSTVEWSGGSVGIQSRWRTGFHKFTWGAGLEAMRPSSRP